MKIKERVVKTVHKDCVPEEVIKGKIMATKMLVKKQAKEVREVETEILKIAAGGLEGAEPDRLEKIAGALREFYICIENAMGFIAHNLEGSIPTGENVHRLLLEQMTAPFPKIRPQVLDEVLKEELEGYMQFRSDLEGDPLVGRDTGRMSVLISNLRSVSAAVRQQLTDFFEDLNKYHGIE